MNKSISLCMIVKNEEKHLNRCLESVKDKVDEIIIVDTGSSDSTIEIARRYTSKIYHYEWTNDFSAARNYSLKNATSEYIIIMDADEYLDENADLKKDIKSIEDDYYLFNIKNELSFGASFIHQSVRLFANYRGLCYENRLHEHLNVLNESNNYKGNTASTVIHHTGYTNEIMESKDKIKRNLPLMLKEVEENPTAYNLYNMGKTYMATEEYKKAARYFEKAYPLSGNRSFMPELLTRLAFCLSQNNQTETGLQILNDAVNLYPQDVEMRYIQGGLFVSAGYMRDAEFTFMKCLEIGDKGTMVTEGSGGYMARFSLAEIYEQQGRMSESYDQIVKVIQSKKSFAPGLRKYFEVVSKTNIPLEDIHNNIKLIYNISNVNDLQLLLDVLYGLRHPLLDKYLSQYSISVQPNVTAAAKQYSKQYTEASSLWKTMREIPSENGIDLLLLAVLLQDESLYNLAVPYLNLSNKENKLLKTIIYNEQTTINKLSPSIIEAFEKLTVHLIVLQEYEVFERICRILLTGPFDLKYRISNAIATYGYKELAIDLLVQEFKEQPNNIQIVRLLGDICLSSNYLDDAVLFYSRLLEISPDYSSYERCIHLFEKLKDHKVVDQLKMDMKLKFPRSLWIQ